ncbi:MAG: autotransporter-associated beta strand repeat-containing protein [Akkermansiaceae bacterium]|jgi:autotransporter-associated beta strand protein|nr:autotransporter-associated beta strand repeat-containing protein [Akkermansiaceae bacterium]
MKPTRRHQLLLLGSSLLAAPALHAATYTWDGGGGSTSWGTGTNWNPDGAVFNNTTDLIFGASGNQTYTGVGTADGLRTVRSITFTDAFANTSGRIRFNSGGATTGGVMNHLVFSSSTGTANISLQSGMTGSVDMGAGGASVFGETRLASNLVITNSSSTATLNITSAITETTAGRGITKEGAGLVIFSRAASYTGTTTINDGTLRIGNGGATGTLSASSAISVNNNGILEIRRSGTVTQGTDFSSTGITGTGSFIKSGTGTAIFNVANSYTGTTTINGGALRLESSGTISSSSNVVINTAGNWNIRNTDGWTYSGTISGDDTGQINLNTGTNVTLSGNISGLSKIHTNNDGTVATISGDISGSVAIDVQSTGGSTLILSGNNTYTGATRILSSTGVLEVRGSISNSSGIDSIGSLIFNSASNQSYGNVISNTGTLTKQGTGTLTLSAANTHSGATTISGGILHLDNSLALQSSALDTTASVAGSGSAGLRTSSTSLTLGGLVGDKSFSDVFTTTSGGYSGLTAITLNPGTGASNSYTANIGDGAGGMTLTKSGAGLQVLNAANTHTGLTTINAGALRITHADGLGGVTAGTVVNGGTGGTGVARLELAGGVTVAGESVTIRGGGNFVGALSSFSDVNEWAGNVTVDAAGTRIGASAGATLKVSGVIDSGVNSFGLTIRTGDTNSPVVLSGANTYLGDTTILVGKLQLDGGDHRLPTATNLIMGSGTNATEFDLNGRNQEIAGLTLASGATGANNRINNSSATLSTLTVNTTAGAPSSFGGIITGNLALTKAGSDVLTISATNNYTGPTTVTGGSLLVNGNISTSLLTTVQTGATLGGSGTVGDLTIDSGGFFSPGNSPGIMTVDGAYTQNGTLVAELNGLTPGTGHDQVVVNGSVNLAGALSLSFNTFTPVNNDLIFILLNDDTDAISGTFTGFSQGTIVGSYGGYDWQISYQADQAGNSFTGGNDVALQAIVPIPEPRSALLGGLGILVLLRRRRNSGIRSGSNDRWS